MFNLSLCIGFIVPIISLIFGTIGDVDISTPLEISGLPAISLTGTSLALITFGALGRFFAAYINNPWISLLAGLFIIKMSMEAYRFIQNLTNKLKSNKSYALTYEDLVGQEGIITLRVTATSDGTISLKDSTGASISYVAKIKAVDNMDKSYYIPQGEKVVIVDFDIKNKICYVEQLNKIEESKRLE